MRDGKLITEYHVLTEFVFKNGKYVSVEDGAPRFTGMMRFEHDDGTLSPWYTTETAPQWMYDLYQHGMQNEPGSEVDHE